MREASGGGVYLITEQAVKTGGTLYGYSASDADNSNKVLSDSGATQTDKGSAAYVYVNTNTSRRQETTAGPTVNLDASKSGAEGGWEN